MCPFKFQNTLRKQSPAHQNFPFKLFLSNTTNHFGTQDCRYNSDVYAVGNISLHSATDIQRSFPSHSYVNIFGISNTLTCCRPYSRMVRVKKFGPVASITFVFGVDLIKRFSITRMSSGSLAGAAIQSFPIAPS